MCIISIRCNLHPWCLWTTEPSEAAWKTTSFAADADLQQFPSFFPAALSASASVRAEAVVWPLLLLWLLPLHSLIREVCLLATLDILSKPHHHHHHLSTTSATKRFSISIFAASQIFVYVLSSVDIKHTDSWASFASSQKSTFFERLSTLPLLHSHSVCVLKLPV